MGHDADNVRQFDEYLWPLTGEPWWVDWAALTEELQIRQRVAEIMTHVRETHLQPRLRRLGTSPPLARVTAVTQSVIAGPQEGPVWAQTLKAPVPGALRDEWAQLTERLRVLEQQRTRSHAPPTATR